ncbi:hypothetical protein TNCV_5068531 [Trichonephila clavipes]|nr:hypothetical protein TNCV_5068531 [Trichonephila clavipes]
MNDTLLQQHLRSATGTPVSTQTVRNRLPWCRDEIFRPIVVSYAAGIGDDFILMVDDSRPHHAKLAKKSIFEEGIVRMEWSDRAVFFRHESSRARLRCSRKTSCWPPTTLINSPRAGKSSSGRVEQNNPTRD